MTVKIEAILAKKRQLELLDLGRELRAADNLLAELELSRDLTQHIVHVDCDAFYAAVEQLDRPELKGLPFAVGGGVLTTCNYVARGFGCRSGMASFVAKKLCPELIIIPLNFSKYTAKASEVREVLAEYDPRFESASIDEAYLNITEYCANHNMDPADAVTQMRSEIFEKTRVTVSAGIAANSRLAKICSNMNKPNGQYILPRERSAIMHFMRDLPCRKVNGIGRVLERELASVGIRTCGDIYLHRQYIDRLFGQKTYEFLLRCHLGLGRTNIQPAEEYERKSVGTERTFRDISDPVQLRETLRRIADDLEADMKRAECKGRTLCIKVKLHTFEVLTRQVVPPKAVCLADDLYNYSLPMLARLEQEIPSMKIRLMGLRCTQLVSTKRPDTRAFFGLRPQKPVSDEPGKEGSNTGEGEAGGVDPQRAIGGGLTGDVTVQRDLGSDQNGGPDSPGRMHREDVAPNTLDSPSNPTEEALWDCPVCGWPQPADERHFNAHIDLCLSRQVIKEAVQQGTVAQQQPPPEQLERRAPEMSKGREKKRARLQDPLDRRQKKLCFG